MSAFSDREATLSRLSKLQREIEQLTDALNRKPKSKAKSLSYEDSSRSSSRASSRRTVLHGSRSNSVTEHKSYLARTQLQPSPSYASKLREIEARYATSGFEHVKPVLAAAQTVSSLIPSGQPIKSSEGSWSWTSGKSSADTGQLSDVAGSSGSSFSFQPVGSLPPSGQPVKFSRGSRTWTSNKSSTNTAQLLDGVAGSRRSLFSLPPAGGYQLQLQTDPPARERERNTSQQQTSKLSHRSQVQTTYSHDLHKKSKILLNNQVKRVEEKYLVSPKMSIMHDQGRLVLHPSSSLSNDPPRVKLLTRKVISPSTSKQSSKNSSHVQSTSTLKSSSSDRKSSKYSWRQPSHTKHSQDESRKLPSSGVKKSPFKFEKSHGSSGSRDSSRTSTSSRSSSRDANRSKYHYDSRSFSGSSAHRKRRHSEEHHTHSSPYSTSKYKLTTRPSSSRPNTSFSGVLRKQYTPDRKYDNPPVHTSSSNSRFTSKSGQVYIRGRGQTFLSSRVHTLPTRRGRGFVTFRGRGSRGRGYARGAGVFRGQGAPGYSPRTKRVLGSSYSPRYRGKGRSSRHVFTRAPPKKLSSGEGFRSKYALMKTSLARNTLKKPLSFMEKRRLTVLNDTPVLLRSKYKLVKGHRSVLRPALLSASLVTPLRKTPTVKRLVTVKNTTTKLIRRAAGDPRPSGSTVNLQGAQFKLRINRFSKTLYRLPSNVQVSTSSVRRLVMKSTTPSVTRKVASHVLQRSINISLAAKHRSKKLSSTKQYCMFYNLYGRCKRGNDCPYIHDPEKVAVCTRFLRGTCPKTDGSCLFSHKVSKEKMPVCSYFLRGVCNRDDCPYSHVKVSSQATVCPDFIKGYCPLGEKCKKKHILRCPDFTLTGKCANGAKCPLLHKRDPTKSNKGKTKTRKSSTQDSETVKVRTPDRTPTAKHKKGETSFIQLSSDTPSNKTAPSMPETSENGSSFQRNTIESQQMVGSGEGASIIPSFVKLSTADRNKSVAPSVAKTAGSVREPAIIPRLRRTVVSTNSKTSQPAQENDVIQSSSRKLRSDTRPSVGESSKPSKGLPSTVPPTSADHHPHVEMAHALPKSGDSSFIDLNVTPPSLSAAGEGSGSEELPSFIELYPGSPFSPMKESTYTAQQESDVTRTLQIRPQFKRLFKSENPDITKKTDTAGNR